MRSIFALACFALASLSPAPQAATPHFTFHVPVHITNSPSAVTRVAVMCFVFYNSSTLGADTVTVPLSGGNYSGTLTVPVNVTIAAGPSHAIDPSLVNRWGCGVQWLLDGAWRAPRYVVNPPGTRGAERWDAAAGTTLRDIVQGTIP